MALAKKKSAKKKYADPAVTSEEAAPLMASLLSDIDGQSTPTRFLLDSHRTSKSKGTTMALERYVRSGDYDNKILGDLKNFTDLMYWVYENTFRPLARSYNRLSRHLSDYTKATKPPLSMSSALLEDVESRHNDFLQDYKFLLRITSKIAAKAAKAKGISMSLQLIQKEIITPVPPRTRDGISLLSLLGMGENLIGSSRVVEKLRSLNELSKATIFSKQYKGAFLLAPSVIGDNGPINTNTRDARTDGQSMFLNGNSHGAYSYDTKHYMYRLNSEFSRRNPYFPSTANMGPRLSRSGVHNRSSLIDMEVCSFVELSASRPSTMTAGMYYQKVMTNYARKIRNHFQETYGIAVWFRVDFVDLSSSAARREKVNQVRRFVGTTSDGTVPMGRIRGTLAQNTGGVPFIALEENGDIKAEYHHGAFCWITINYGFPVDKVSLLSIAEDEVSKEDRDKEVKENVTDIFEEKNLAAHPRMTARGHVRAVDNNLMTNLIRTSASSLEIPPEVHGSPFFQTNSSDVNTSVSGNYISGSFASAQFLSPSHLVPIMKMTESVLHASDDIISVLSTLTRRLLRGTTSPRS